MTPETHALPQSEPPISNARLAMLLFVASEAMLFTGLIAGYVVLGYGSRDFAGMLSLPLGLAPLGVVVLVASSAALIMAQRAIRGASGGAASGVPGEHNVAPELGHGGALSASDGHARVARWSLAALLLGVAFLGVQAIEWSSLLGAGMLPGSAVNAGMLYVVGGVHGLHVIGGLVLLAILAVRAMRSPEGPATRSAATITALYWHFVTIVWITLFLMLFIL